VNESLDLFPALVEKNILPMAALEITRFRSNWPWRQDLLAGEPKRSKTKLPGYNQSPFRRPSINAWKLPPIALGSLLPAGSANPYLACASRHREKGERDVALFGQTLAVI